MGAEFRWTRMNKFEFVNRSMITFRVSSSTTTTTTLRERNTKLLLQTNFVRIRFRNYTILSTIFKDAKLWCLLMLPLYLSNLYKIPVTQGDGSDKSGRHNGLLPL